MLVVMHIIALHEVGSNNPDGVEIKKNKDENGIPLDGIPFHPYYTVKDIVGVVGFLILFSFVVFFAPEMGGYFLEYANFVPANQFKTPEHIAPVWYFTPFYAILRAIPHKLTGVIAMFGSIALLFLMPWIDRGKVRSIRYRSSTFRWLIVMLVVSFIGLGYLGALPLSDNRTLFARIFTVGYFGFFVLLWWISKNEVTKPVPERVQ
jgi:ubiquinol-cytochrome c reductase cytochrome b subunit